MKSDNKYWQIESIVWTHKFNSPSCMSICFNLIKTTSAQLATQTVVFNKSTIHHDSAKSSLASCVFLQINLINRQKRIEPDTILASNVKTCDVHFSVIQSRKCNKRPASLVPATSQRLLFERCLSFGVNRPIWRKFSRKMFILLDVHCFIMIEVIEYILC